MKVLNQFIFLISLLCIGSQAFSQTEEKVYLEQADSLERVTINGKVITKVLGNVVFRQKGTVLYCDSAYQDVAANALETFGHVRIVQGDSVTITGNKGFYYGNTKQAKMRGNVVLVDPTMTLYTEQLDYDMNANLAYYFGGGADCRWREYAYQPEGVL